MSLFDSLAMSEILHKPLFIIQEIHIVKGKSTILNRQSLENIPNGSEPTRTPNLIGPRPNSGVSAPFNCRSELNLIANITLLNRHAHKQLANHFLAINTSTNKMSCRIAGSAVHRFSQSLIEQVRGMPRSSMQDFCRMEMHVQMRFDKVVRIGMLALRIHGKALAHQQDVCRRRCCWRW